MLARKLRGTAIMCIALFLLAALVLGGCGKKQEGEGETQQQNGVFDAGRLPGIGSTYEYLLSNPLPSESQGLPVNFALEAGWDFTSGPTDTTAKVTLISPEGKPGAERFPGASLCVKSESYGETAYVYYLQDQAARKLMGTYLVSEEGQEFWDRYNPPKTILTFPLEAPASEPLPEDVTHTTSEGFSETITCRSTVRWIDTVKVPAGEFPNAVMVQFFDIHNSESGTYSDLAYAWYAPDVGQVAFISSFPNETQTAFNRATEFRRLTSYQVPE